MISKERLWEIQRSISQRGCAVLTGFQCGRLSMVESLIEECDNDNTLVVSKLNPMCDLIIRARVLVKLNVTDSLREAYRDVADNIWLDGVSIPYKLDECEGWVAMPIYKP